MIDPDIASILVVPIVFVVSTAVAATLYKAGFPLPAGNRTGYIDGLRGYLALAVLCHHFSIWIGIERFGRQWESPPSAFLKQLGAGGVGLFFMVTGLVFYPRILSGVWKIKWLSLYISRIFRIVPLLILTIFAVTAIIVSRTNLTIGIRYPWEVLNWIIGQDHVDLLGYPQAYRINAGVLWSLYYEWFFYIAIIPACAIARAFVGERTWLIPAGLLGVAAVCQILKVHGAIYLPLFAFGMAAGEIRKNSTFRNWLSGYNASAIALAALLIGMFFFHGPYRIALPLFGFFFVCVASGNSMFGVLRTKGALVLGECSYGIYLTHGIFLALLFEKNLTSFGTSELILVSLPLVAIIVVITTGATFLLIERPFIQLGSQIANRIGGRQRPIDRQERDITP